MPSLLILARVALGANERTDGDTAANAGAVRGVSKDVPATGDAGESLFASTTKSWCLTCLTVDTRFPLPE